MTATKTQTAALKRKARVVDDAYAAAAKSGEADARAGRPAEPSFGEDADAYAAGYETTKAHATKTKTASTKKTATKKTTTKRAPKKAPARKRARATGRSRARGRTTAKARRAVTAPIQGQFVSGMTAIGGMFALAVLYNVLIHAETTTAVISGAARAVKWLDSTKSIPYGGN